MADTTVWKTLLFKDSAEIDSILEQAFEQYCRDIYNIAADIYDSCIEDFYDQYTPIKYGRHGNINGFNLYYANDIYYDSESYLIDIDFDPNNLLKYDVPKSKGKYREKRDKVLKMVMAGLRGGSSRKSPPGWPMPWDARYPNTYSKYNLWSSYGRTLNEIYTDFMANVMTDTKDIFISYIQQYL